jgi:hypothetical protein
VNAMTHKGGPLTESQKAYVFAALVPILWPLLFAMILCDLGSAIANTSFWCWLFHRKDLHRRDWWSRTAWCADCNGWKPWGIADRLNRWWRKGP